MTALSYYRVLDFMYKRRGNMFLSCFYTYLFFFIRCGNVVSLLFYKGPPGRFQRVFAGCCSYHAVAASISFFFFFFFFFLRFYLFIHETHREIGRDTDRGRSMEPCMEPDVGLQDPGTQDQRPGSWVSRIRPWAEGGAKPLSHPGCPDDCFYL